ncbi:hypothetical protein C1X72_18900 [Pseudomonas sp. FW306-2-2C-D06B]|uniref:Core-binding (CB) domain-containing protein n=1 Tax=Pseudomonas putida TaxID=303 RepID=A0A1L7N8C1_PSEPU|nr:MULTISPECIES: hypothetical protein [Pseudomonas]PMY79662.1 hypothetical protein C1X72_18900 [Pseudomonas sp. FW306-2-2C-D06B]BAW21676.1 Uncharacterized protein KF715C_ch11030 [Pseudomonas putida]GLO19864.1 hypothetical protein PPUJ20188_32610 [Pseudomonas putida]HDS0995236.1 hypothetical protein [Pseudomonas putida]HDS1760595.1 hypothetical protein [Pseudomonas putida]
MSKRKVFVRTNLSVPQVEHRHDAAGDAVILPQAIPANNTIVEFGLNTSKRRCFDFARWYGVGIDTITYACQRQIERFLAGQDGALTATTVAGYCVNGLRNFLDCCMLRVIAFGRDLLLTDISRDLIDGYLGHLAGLGVATTSQKVLYTQTKPVLLALGRRGLIPLIASGDMATFPSTPFPDSRHKYKSETGLTNRERQAFTAALRQAIKPIWTDGVSVTGELLAFALLVVALHTGRNNTPLLEMGRNCLRPHPKDDTVFLILWKRRGYNTSKVALRAESDVERLLESTSSVRTSVERLIRRVMVLTEPLDAEAPTDLKGRVWLYRTRASKNVGNVTALSSPAVAIAASRLVTKYNLTDSDGKPLRINISRLRKTFANGIFELTGGDVAITAAALGNTLQITDQHYLAPSEEARRNWQFMGEVLVQELLTRTIGTTYRDPPMGRCADPENGQYAPKREGATCMNFINCLRCKHYAVTAEDLYKLFSFYFRVLAERSRMDKKLWAREYAHIPRLIDHYIIDEGLRRGTFRAAAVEAAREHARNQPHPFWSIDLIESLEVFA